MSRPELVAPPEIVRTVDTTEDCRILTVYTSIMETLRQRSTPISKMTTPYA